MGTAVWLLLVWMVAHVAVVLSQPTWNIVECPTPFTWSNVSSQGDFTLSGGQGCVMLELIVSFPRRDRSNLFHEAALSN